TTSSLATTPYTPAPLRSAQARFVSRRSNRAWFKRAGFRSSPNPTTTAGAHFRKCGRLAEKETPHERSSDRSADEAQSAFCPPGEWAAVDEGRRGPREEQHR